MCNGDCYKIYLFILAKSSVVFDIFEETIKGFRTGTHEYRIIELGRSRAAAYLWCQENLRGRLPYPGNGETYDVRNTLLPITMEGNVLRSVCQSFCSQGGLPPRGSASRGCASMVSPSRESHSRQPASGGFPPLGGVSALWKVGTPGTDI